MIFYGESDEAPGITAGDIYVRVHIKKHKEYVRKGADLFMNKKITLVEALTGLTFELKHLDGKSYNISTMPNEVLSVDAIKTVSKKGMPFYKD